MPTSTILPPTPVKRPKYPAPLALHVKWALGHRYRPVYSEPPQIYKITDTITVSVLSIFDRPEKSLRLKQVEAREQVAFGFKTGYVEHGRFTPYYDPTTYKHN